MAKSATVRNFDKHWSSAYELNWDNRFFREFLFLAIDSTKTVIDRALYYVLGNFNRITYWRVAMHV